MVVPSWPSIDEVADDEGGHGGGEHQARRGDDAAGTRHRADVAGLEARVAAPP